MAQIFRAVFSLFQGTSELEQDDSYGTASPLSNSNSSDSSTLSARSLLGEVQNHNNASPKTLTDRVRAMIDSSNSANESAASKSALNPKASSTPTYQPTTYPTVFHWAHGGNNVYLTGDFNGWTGKIPMSKSNHDFSLIVDMPPGKYLYKFIVDNEWRYAPDQPTETDRHGILNNLVEINPQNIYEFDGTDREDSLLNLSDMAGTALEQRSPLLHPRAPGEEFALEYSQEIPILFNHNVSYSNTNSSSLPKNQILLTAADYMKDPPALPPHLYEIFLNSNSKYSDPYVLPIPPPVTLHHLFNATPLARMEDVLTIAMTQRHHSKFVTTVLYKPNPKLAKGVAAAAATATAVPMP